MELQIWKSDSAQILLRKNNINKIGTRRHFSFLLQETQSLPNENNPVAVEVFSRVNTFLCTATCHVSENVVHLPSYASVHSMITFFTSERVTASPKHAWNENTCKIIHQTIKNKLWHETQDDEQATGEGVWSLIFVEVQKAILILVTRSNTITTNVITEVQFTSWSLM